jgi:methionyl-tRNA formyltransferase
VIAGIAKDRFMVSCGDNTVLAITELQLPGKNRMTTRDFLNGKGRQLIIEAKEIK